MSDSADKMDVVIVGAGLAGLATAYFLADAGLEASEYTPLTIKQAITGYGKADKAQMQEMVRLLLGLDEVPRPDDAADALAVAICHLHQARLAALTEDVE